MKKNKIIINNQLVSYLANETAGEKRLLFLHGWRSSKEVWGQIVNKLISEQADKQINIYAIDLPGFGGSSLTPPSPSPSKGGNSAGMSVGDYAEMVKGFIEKLDLKNVIIVGHSFGGRVGIKLCGSPTTPPLDKLGTPLLGQEGRIKKLVLVDSAGFAIKSWRKNLMEIAAKIVKPFFKPKFMQGLRKKIYQKLGAEDYLATPELQKTFINVVGEDLTEDMKNISCPTLIIWGENDKATPPSFGERMHALVPNSKFQILKQAGHFSFLDQPEEFVEILNNFI